MKVLSVQIGRSEHGSGASCVPMFRGPWERFGDTGVVSLWSSGPLRIQELCLLKVSDLQGLDGVG